MKPAHRKALVALGLFGAGLAAGGTFAYLKASGSVRGIGALRAGVNTGQRIVLGEWDQLLGALAGAALGEGDGRP